MSKRSRNDLKDLFKQGKMPGQEDFADLIDSSLNTLDESFDRDAQNGMKMAQVGGGVLQSYYRDINAGDPLWRLGMEPDGALSLCDGQQEPHPVLTLTSTDDGRGGTRNAVGIGCTRPGQALDVVGTVAADGWIGRAGQRAVPADGEWHDITGALTGCQAWEVMAGAGTREGAGQYALTHAFAMNAFNGSGNITHHQAYFRSRSSRIELRWSGVDKKTPFGFKLQMRVGCNYGQNVWIKYHMTQLWFDSQMEQSSVPPGAGPRPPPAGGGR